MFSEQDAREQRKNSYLQKFQVLHTEFEFALRDRGNIQRQQQSLDSLNQLCMSNCDLEDIEEVARKQATLMFDMGAIVYLGLKEFYRAEKIWQDAFKRHEQCYGSQYYLTGWVRHNQAKLARDLRKYAEQKLYLEQTFMIYRNCYNAKHANIARILFELGIVHRALQEQVSSILCFERALAIYEEQSNPDSKVMARIYFELGMIEESFKNVAKSGEYFKKAYALSLVGYGAEHRQTQLALQYLEKVRSSSTTTSSEEKVAQSSEEGVRQNALGVVSKARQKPDFSIQSFLN